MRTDHQAREAALHRLGGTLEWAAFRQSAHDEIAGLQIRVNDLNTQGPELDRLRVRLGILREIATGEMLKEFISSATYAHEMMLQNVESEKAMREQMGDAQMERMASRRAMERRVVEVPVSDAMLDE